MEELKIILKKKSKDELIELVSDLLYWHDKQYNEVKNGSDLFSAFYQLSGNFTSIKKRASINDFFNQD